MYHDTFDSIGPAAANKPARNCPNGNTGESVPCDGFGPSEVQQRNQPPTSHTTNSFEVQFTNSTTLPASHAGDSSATAGDSSTFEARYKLAKDRRSQRQSVRPVPDLHGNAPATMFADAQAMKGALHEDLDKKDYDVTDFYKETGIAQAIARSEVFGTITLTVIGINAVWIGVDSDHNDAVTLAQAELHFQIMEHLFCVFFSFEWAVRFLSFANKRDCLRDNWFKFDTCLVTLMVAETWIIPLASSGGGTGMSNLSLLKMLRLLRLTRMVRIMRAMPELMTMLKGMAAASRSVGATFTLLIIFMYIFAIIFASQLADNEELSADFGTIPKAMWSLLLGGTFQDNLTEVAEGLMTYSHPLLVAIFLLFVLISSLTILNMLIGVLCEVVSAVAEAEKEKAVVTYVKSSLIDVLTDLDKDGTGTISKEEFAGFLEVPSAVAALEQLGVDVQNLLSLADVLFDADSAPKAPRDKSATTVVSTADSVTASENWNDQSEEGPVELTFSELLEMILRLRSEKTASVPDIVDLRKFIRWSTNHQCDTLKELRKELDSTKRDMRYQLDLINQKIDLLMKERTPTNVDRPDLENRTNLLVFK